MAFDWTDLIKTGAGLGGSLLGNSINAGPAKAGVKENARQFDIRTQRADQARAMLMPALQRSLGSKGSLPSSGMYAPSQAQQYGGGGGGLGGAVKTGLGVASMIPGVLPKAGGALAGLLGGGGAATKVGLGGYSATGGGAGLGGTLGALATNPITWAAAAGLGGIIAAKKIGQGRKAANRLTGPQGAQGQFGQVMEELTKRGLPPEQFEALLAKSLDAKMQQARSAIKNKNDSKVLNQWIGDFSKPEWASAHPGLGAVAQRYAGSF